MSLPKLNDTPKYHEVIPSTGQEISYRPFLVKEEKVLLIAMESSDPKQMAMSISDTVSSCIYENIDIAKLTGYDIEYLFLKIRGKSVGEVSSVMIECNICDHANEVNINLDEIKIPENAELNNIIKLNDDISVQMKPPSYVALAANPIITGDGPLTEKIFGMLRETMDAVLTEEERISMKETSQQDFEEFVESMTTEQFNKVKEYVESIPTLSHEIKFDCEGCGATETRTLEGMQNFF